MTVYFRLLLSLAVCALGLAHAADERTLSARQGKGGDQRVALVIGNAAYGAAPLKNPVNDARAIAAKLEKLGFSVVKRENLTIRQIGSTLREFRARLSPGAEALFFYAGHGLQVKGVNYLPAVDADITSEEDVPNQSINVSQVLEILDDTKTRLNLIFLDACRNNPFTRRFRSAGGGLAKIEAPSGTKISFATRPGSVAADGEGRNGLYTEHLLRVMDERGLPIEQALKKVYSGVKQASKGAQEPWEEGTIEGEFYFLAAGGTQVAQLTPQFSGARTAAQIEDELWDAIKGDDRVSVFEEYIRQYPNGRYLAQARVRLVGLREGRPAAVPPAPTPGAAFKDCAECPEMVIIPAGSFDMGAPASEPGRYDDEGPVHRVAIKSFAAGKYEITRRQFAAFVSATGYDTGNECRVLDDKKWEYRGGLNWRNPGYAQGDDHPVVCVNWADATAYAAWLGSQTGKSYRLLGEAEWEYAARAGTTTARYWGDSPDQACAYANVGDQTTKTQIPGWVYGIHNCMDGQAYTSAAGNFKPNAFGLYDMIGNVWEWTNGCWNNNYSGAPGDGSDWMAESCSIGRARRGGSWVDSPQNGRAAVRSGDGVSSRSNGLGFRIGRTLP